MKNKYFFNGFTLVELIITMAIIGVLITVATVNYEKVRVKSRDSKRKTDLANIAIAMDSYHTDNDRFPGAKNSTYWSTRPQPWIPTLDKYINPVPVETGPNLSFSYTAFNNPCPPNLDERNYIYRTETCFRGVTCPEEGVGVTGYILIARLELYDDPNLTSVDTSCNAITIPYGDHSSINLKGHPLYTISK